MVNDEHQLHYHSCSSSPVITQPTNRPDDLNLFSAFVCVHAAFIEFAVSLRKSTISFGVRHFFCPITILLRTTEVLVVKSVSSLQLTVTSVAEKISETGSDKHIFGLLILRFCLSFATVSPIVPSKADAMIILRCHQPTRFLVVVAKGPFDLFKQTLPKAMSLSS